MAGVVESRVVRKVGSGDVFGRRGVGQQFGGGGGRTITTQPSREGSHDEDEILGCCCVGVGRISGGGTVWRSGVAVGAGPAFLCSGGGEEVAVA